MVRSRRRWWVVGALAGLAVATVVGPNVWVSRSADGQVYPVEEAPHRSVAIVLGAGLTPEGRPTPFLAARLDIAREPTAMRDHLVADGVPSEQVVLDFAGRDTYDTCVRAKRIFEVPDAIIVSQGYHVPRAVAVCNAIGLDTIGVGDETARQWSGAWRSGRQREYLANVKAAADVLSGRDPVLGEVEPGITEALARARADDK